ncbi:MAG: YdcF family protein [Armatimonadetes bacterium]|nr:YdcF family protein [Armatimonadota bacterium]
MFQWLIPGLDNLPVAATFCILGALGFHWLPQILWGGAAVTLSLLLLIAYTDLSGALIHSLTRSAGGASGRAPAVVVLSSESHYFGSSIAARMQEAYRLLARGQADRLVLTRIPSPARSFRPIIEEQLRLFQLDVRIDEVGPVRNTHDEALAVAKLARERNWDRVLLVTQAWHMPRAAKAFRKAGVEVIPSPAREYSFDLDHPRSVEDRLEAFGIWLHEIVGIWLYRRRGWA